MSVNEKSEFMLAFEGRNRRVPVWFMRQAGRYLPAYRALKEKYSLDQLFDQPELAAEVTCLPFDILDVDAGILFADILTLLKLMGLPLRFDDKRGPVFSSLALADLPQSVEKAEGVCRTIRIVKERLPAGIPLIGFAGAPMTVLSYCVEGGSSLNYRRFLNFLNSETVLFHQWMEILTVNTIDYLKQQIAAGVDAVQLFESWGAIIPAGTYRDEVLPYVRRIFESVSVPAIFFMKGCAPLLEDLRDLPCEVLSVDHGVDLRNPHVQNVLAGTGVQGNLFNGFLYADPDRLRHETRQVLEGGAHFRRYIFNLSHGVFPDVHPDQLKRVVDWVHQFSLPERS